MKNDKKKQYRKQLIRTPSFIEELKDWELDELIMYSSGILMDKKKQLWQLEKIPDYEGVDVLNETVTGMEVHKEQALLHLLKTHRRGEPFGEKERGLKIFVSMRSPKTDTEAKIILGPFQEKIKEWEMVDWLKEYRERKKNQEFNEDKLDDPFNELPNNEQRKIEAIAEYIDRDGRSDYKFEEVKTYLAVYRAYPELDTRETRKKLALKLVTKESSKRLEKAQSNTLGNSWENKLNKAL